MDWPATLIKSMIDLPKSDLVKAFILAQVLLTAVIWLLFRRDCEILTDVYQLKARIAVRTAEIHIESELTGLREDAAMMASAGGSAHLSRTGVIDTATGVAAHLISSRISYLDAGLISEDGEWKSFSGKSQLSSSGNSLNFLAERATPVKKGEVWLSGFTIKSDPVSGEPAAVISAMAPFSDGPDWLYLDLRASRLGSVVRRIGRHIGVNVDLMNEKGELLIRGDGADILAVAQLEADQVESPASAHPELWKQMLTHPAANHYYSDQYWVTYAVIEPNTLTDSAWLILSYRDQEQIQALLQPLQLRYFWSYAGLTVLLVIVAAFLAVKARAGRETGRKLAESEERFRLIVDSAPDAMMIVDQEGRIQTANRQAENWFGYPVAELVGQPVELLVPSELRGKHALSRETFFEGPRLRAMGSGMELYGQRKDGQRFPVEISLSPINVGGKKYVTAIVRDISERENLENARRQMADRYRQLVEYLPVGVFRAEGDHHTCFREANAAMLELLAAPKMEALRNLKIKDLLVEPADRASLENALQARASVKQFEALLRRLDGSQFFGLISCTEGTDEMGGKHFEGIIKDISARKRYELEIQRLNEALTVRTSELEYINHELETFSYSVSHDLQVPLRAIDSSAATLVRDCKDRLDEKGIDRLERIQTTAQRMSRLFDDLLNLYRVSRANIHWRSVDFSALAEEIVAELQSAEPARHVKVNIQPRMWGNADPHLIRVALTHLIGNAWKFTARKEEAVLTVGCNVDNGEPVYFVKDNGAGFEARFVDKFFGASQRFHNEEDFPGTGMGLATVERILHRHGGRIWAHSEINEGSTFFFQIGPANRNGRS